MHRYVEGVQGKVIRCRKFSAPGDRNSRNRKVGRLVGIHPYGSQFPPPPPPLCPPGLPRSRRSSAPLWSRRWRSGMTNLKPRCGYGATQVSSLQLRREIILQKPGMLRRPDNRESELRATLIAGAESAAC